MHKIKATKMSKAKDLLETVKYMIIESGFDTVPQSLLKKAIDTALLELEVQSKECDGCEHYTCTVKNYGYHAQFCVRCSREKYREDNYKSKDS